MTDAPQIQVQINQERYVLPADSTIEQALSRLGLAEEGIALAVNQSVVPANQWQEKALQDQDHIQLFQAIAGG